MDRKQSFNGFVQDVLLEPSKESNDFELDFDDLIEELYRKMDEILRPNRRAVLVCWSVQGKNSARLMMNVDWDEEENWIGCGDERDVDEDLETSAVYLHRRKLHKAIRDHLAARILRRDVIFLERNNDSIRGKSNGIIDSIGKVCFKIVKNPKRLKRSGNQNSQGRWSRDHPSTSRNGIRSNLYSQCGVFEFVFVEYVYKELITPKIT